MTNWEVGKRGQGFGERFINDYSVLEHKTQAKKKRISEDNGKRIEYPLEMVIASNIICTYTAIKNIQCLEWYKQKRGNLTSYIQNK